MASDFRARSLVRLSRDHQCAHCAESRLLLSVSQDLPWSLDSEEEQRICDYQLYDAGKDPKKNVRRYARSCTCQNRAVAVLRTAF